MSLLHRIVLARYNIFIALNLVFRFMPRHDSSVLMLVNVLRAIIILLLISFSDLPSSVIKLPRYMYRDSSGARLCVNAAPICQKAHHFLPHVP